MTDVESVSSLDNTKRDSLNVIVKTTEACVLDCVYCYEGRKSGKIMSLETLEAMITKLESRNPGNTSTDYTWHGAEPLMAGLDFFRAARELQGHFERKGNRIDNGLQTSGVLLDEEFADFFAQENIRVGFSLDGPRQYHDMQRPYLDGSSSFDHVMRGIQLMRERGQNNGVIVVLTQWNLPHLNEIYEFFKKEGIPFKINPVIRCGNADNRYDTIGLKPGQYARALINIFEMAYRDDAGVFDPAEKLIASLFTREDSTCSSLPSCQESFIGVDTEGYVVPCSRFTRDQVCYGNIKEEDLSDILNHPMRLKLQERNKGIKSCNERCEINELCYSGCMHNAFISGDISGKDPLCADTLIVSRYVQNRVMAQLKADGAIIGGT